MPGMGYPRDRWGEILCFNEHYAIQVRAVVKCFLKFCASVFHLAAITRVIQKLCFCALTELDVAEDKKLESKTD